MPKGIAPGVKKNQRHCVEPMVGSTHCNGVFSAACANANPLAKASNPIEILILIWKCSVRCCSFREGIAEFFLLRVQFVFKLFAQRRMGRIIGQIMLLVRICF